jgi:hypothetical protein
MDNDITAEQAGAIRRLCIAIAISDRGAEQVGIVPGWDT